MWFALRFPTKKEEIKKRSQFSHSIHFSLLPEETICQQPLNVYFWKFMVCVSYTLDSKMFNSCNWKSFALKTLPAASCFKSLLWNLRANIQFVCSWQCAEQPYHELWVASVSDRTVSLKAIYWEMHTQTDRQRGREGERGRREEEKEGERWGGETL